MKKIKSSKQKMNVYQWVIIALVILIGGMGIYISNAQKQSGEPQAVITETNSAPEYKFEYMRARCQEGMDNYDNLLDDVKAEAKRIEEGMDQANAQSSIELFNIYKSDNDKLQKSVNTLIERRGKLRSCIDSVDQRLEFSPSELADLSSYISSSTSIPVVD